MKFTCRTCSEVFRKFLTLREKNMRFKPSFCSEDCAVAWVSVKNKEVKKVKRVGARGSSKEELEFGKIIKNFFPDLIPQHKLKGYEHYYDFYCPSLNLLIEYNGSYWHNKRFMRIKDTYHIAEATKRKVYIAMIGDAEWKSFVDSKNKMERKEVLEFLNSSIKNMTV